MSIEKALADLTTAITANTAALDKMMNGAGAAKAPAAGAAAAGTKAAGTKAGGTKAKAITVDDIRNAFGGYMSGTKDKGEREERKANVAAIVVHFGVERATDIAEENRVEAMGYIKQLEAGEKPDFMNEGGEDEADEGESLL